MQERARHLTRDFDFGPYEAAARETASTDPAHDFLHVQRVFQNATRILQSEPKADATVVLVAVLLHELFNYPKGHPLSSESGDACAERAQKVLLRHGFPDAKRALVLDCIRNHSFSKGVIPSHLEGRILQDADRLDAIGAIGVARCFATCSEMGRPFYDEGDPFAYHRSLDDKSFGLDHFPKKLLLLASGMHTAAARAEAETRTRFMQAYVAELRNEIVPR